MPIEILERSTWIAVGIPLICIDQRDIEKRLIRGVAFASELECLFVLAQSAIELARRYELLAIIEMLPHLEVGTSGKQDQDDQIGNANVKVVP